MIPVEQRQLHDAEHTGDCWRCVLASILEVPYEDVPHFYEMEERGEVESAWNATIAFLRPRGFLLASFGLWGQVRPWLKWGNHTDDLEVRFAFTAPGHWIASVVSPRVHAVTGEPLSHVVVMHGHEIAWDPHPQRDDGHCGFEQAYLLVAA